MKKLLLFVVVVALLSSCATSTAIYEQRGKQVIKLKRWEKPQCVNNW